MGETQIIGANGEQAAVDYLVAESFIVVARNWRSGRYEIDIVAEKNGVLHFVEVKCRKSHGLTTPEDAITPGKFRALSAAATAYIEMYNKDQEVQFDLVAVEYDGQAYDVRYIPNAMISRW